MGLRQHSPHPHTRKVKVSTCWQVALLSRPRPTVYIHRRVADHVWAGSGTHGRHIPKWEREWVAGWVAGSTVLTHTPRAGVGTYWQVTPMFRPRPAVYIHRRVAERVWAGLGTHGRHIPRWEREWVAGWVSGSTVLTHTHARSQCPHAGR